MIIGKWRKCCVMGGMWKVLCDERYEEIVV